MLASHNNKLSLPSEVYAIGAQVRSHPERYLLGKPHPDRAKQFKPFAALRGYEERIAEVFEKANESNDFSEYEEPC